MRYKNILELKVRTSSFSLLDTWSICCCNWFILFCRGLLSLKSVFDSGLKNNSWGQANIFNKKKKGKKEYLYLQRIALFMSVSFFYGIIGCHSYSLQEMKPFIYCVSSFLGLEWSIIVINLSFFCYGSSWFINVYFISFF